MDKIQWILVKNTIYYTLLIFTLLVTSGCATNTFEQETINSEQQAWMQSITSYRSNDIDINSALNISDDMRTLVKERFGNQRKNVAITNLAHWLMNEDGHNMKYDLAANLTPIEAYKQKLGNCLSFTLLLVNLAKAIDIELEYNDVHLANAWGMNDKHNGITLFRHINAIQKTFNRTQIFDLAIEQYNYGLPQKIITEQQALAGLYSNTAVEKLEKNDLENALHNIKLSIALYPKKSDFWVNLGVIYKRKLDFKNAERSLLHALNLNDTDDLASSNLEKLYRQQGQIKKANHFKKKAFYARQKNPYIHYNQANDYVEKQQYSLAKKSISKAKKLHNQDPRFFVLSSLIEQHYNNYPSAIRDIETAYDLTVSTQDRINFSKKARLLAVKAANYSGKTEAFSNSYNDSDLFDSTID